MKWFFILILSPASWGERLLSIGGGGGSQAKQSRAVCFCLASLAGERQLSSCAFYPRGSYLLAGSTLREFQPPGTFLQAWKGKIGRPQAWVWWKLERFCVATDRQRSQSKTQPCLQHQLFKAVHRHASKCNAEPAKSVAAML